MQKIFIGEPITPLLFIFVLEEKIASYFYFLFFLYAVNTAIKPHIIWNSVYVHEG